MHLSEKHLLWRNVCMPKIPIFLATSSSSASLNNLNQTNNVMLWWTEAVGSITFCWGGRFYNRGVGLRYCAPIICHQSRREKYLETLLSSDSSMQRRPRWLFCFNCFPLLWLHVSCLMGLLLSKGSLFLVARCALPNCCLVLKNVCLMDRLTLSEWITFADSTVCSFCITDFKFCSFLIDKITLHVTESFQLNSLLKGMILDWSGLNVNSISRSDVDYVHLGHFHDSFHGAVCFCILFEA